MLAIVDYNAGNQTSVKRALEYLDIPCEIISSPENMASFDGIIFPGVGAAPQAMAQLARTGFDFALKDAVARGLPLLGICLGCQILLESSEEGDVQTLGVLPGKCRLFAPDLKEEDGAPAKIPHMGWNSLKRRRKSRLLDGIPEDAEFYFVHAYYPAPKEELVLSTTVHGMEFCSLFGRDGLWAAQFHPEKSGAPGLKLLANFNDYCMEASHAF